jgi:hypothetical protein
MHLSRLIDIHCIAIIMNKKLEKEITKLIKQFCEVDFTLSLMGKSKQQ